MSEYAEIVEGIVINVVVIDDNWTEEQAQEFLKNISTNKWVKTEEKVGKTYEYHTDSGKFSRPKPFDSWEFDEKTGIYLPPIPRPIAIPVGYVVYWSEELRDWVTSKE